jgi:hypothetical protein
MVYTIRKAGKAKALEKQPAKEGSPWRVMRKAKKGQDFPRKSLY